MYIRKIIMAMSVVSLFLFACKQKEDTTPPPDEYS